MEEERERERETERERERYGVKSGRDYVKNPSK